MSDDNRTPHRHVTAQLCPKCGGRDLRAYKRRYFPPRREVRYCRCFECGQRAIVTVTWQQ